MGEEVKDKKQCAGVVSLQASSLGSVIKRQNIFSLYLHPNLKYDLCPHLYITSYSSLMESRYFIIPAFIPGILGGVASSAAL